MDALESTIVQIIPAPRSSEPTTRRTISARFGERIATPPETSQAPAGDARTFLREQIRANPYGYSLILFGVGMLGGILLHLRFHRA